MEDVELRWEALFEFLGGDNPRLWQLQRALALVSSGISDLGKVEFDIADVLECLGGPDFVIKQDTDYYHLAALVSTLSIAIGDADKPAEARTSQDIIQHDASIDAVVQKLKEIESRIHYGSMNNSGPKMAAKWQLDCLQTMLLCIARSREPTRSAIFGESSAAREGSNLQQKSFMQKFLAKARSQALVDIESPVNIKKGQSPAEQHASGGEGAEDTIFVKAEPPDDGMSNLAW